MNRDELAELHYITPIENLPSIVQHGILSHVRAAKLPHSSVAMQEVQDLRSRKVVPGGRKLHEYANLYFHGRNPMLYKRMNHEICVLAVSPNVLDIPQVVISDSNASSDYARFAPAPEGLRIVSRDMTFAEDWRDSDQIQFWRNRAAKCAEVLVPNRVDPAYLLHAYVLDKEKANKLDTLDTGLTIKIDRYLFFG